MNGLDSLWLSSPSGMHRKNIHTIRHTLLIEWQASRYCWFSSVYTGGSGFKTNNLRLCPKISLLRHPAVVKTKQHTETLKCAFQAASQCGFFCLQLSCSGLSLLGLACYHTRSHNQLIFIALKNPRPNSGSEITGEHLIRTTVCCGCT